MIWSSTPRPEAKNQSDGAGVPAGRRRRASLAAKRARRSLIPAAGNNQVVWRVNTNMNVVALGFGNFGGPDVLVILLIVLILFGAKKLPDLARGLGQSMNEFKKARQDIDRELQDAGASSTSSNRSNSETQGAARSDS